MLGTTLPASSPTFESKAEQRRGALMRGIVTSLIQEVLMRALCIARNKKRRERTNQCDFIHITDFFALYHVQSLHNPPHRVFFSPQPPPPSPSVPIPPPRKTIPHHAKPSPAPAGPPFRFPSQRARAPSSCGRPRSPRRPPRRRTRRWSPGGLVRTRT